MPIRDHEIGAGRQPVGEASSQDHEADRARKPPSKDENPPDLLLARCDSCGGMFPRSQVIDGVCARCMSHPDTVPASEASNP